MAHSEDELDEWKERYSWREMKRKSAREQNFFSYMDQLIDDLSCAKDTSSVVSEAVKCTQFVKYIINV